MIGAFKNDLPDIAAVFLLNAKSILFYWENLLKNYISPSSDVPANYSLLCKSGHDFVACLGVSIILH